MRKKAEFPKPSSISAMILPVLLGTGVALALFFVLALLVAALIWGGILSAAAPGAFLGVCAAICGFVGGRVAIRQGSGEQAMLLGAVTAAVLCIVLLLICFAVSGAPAFPVQLRAVLLSILAGGCFAGMLGGKKRRSKKKRAKK